jgi:anti-sigma B factor antagonist
MVIDDATFTTELVEDCTVVTATGDIDVYNAPELRAVLADASATKRRLVIDLRRVTFMDSSALGVLVGTLKRARSNGGSMRLIRPADRLFRLFQITGLTQVFDFCDTVEDAVRESTERREP